MRAAVLGCGPAGLMAAHAIVRAMKTYGESLELVIWSIKEKSNLYGAQYLHKPIPDASPNNPVLIDYRLRGDASAYSKKVYGGIWNGTVSPNQFNGQQTAWDIRATYDWLWDRYESAIHNVKLDVETMAHIIAMGYGLTVNSIPKDMLCYQAHHFGCVNVIAAGDAPDLGIDIGSQFRCPDGTVICNGEESPLWYRLSRIFGHTTVEWPMLGPDFTVPVKTASQVRKPLMNNCDCWPMIEHVGRYGSWTKGVLSHDAYFQTYKKAVEVLDVTSKA